MVLRHSWVLGLGVGLAMAPALGQTPPGKDAAPKQAAPKHAAATKHNKQLTIAQTITAPAPSSSAARASQPGVPHTLAEALAATYANQPALQAERAKLRATDEAVPQALAGWRPTVILSGNGGYGDGKSVIAGNGPGGNLISTRTQRDIGIAQATLSQPIYTGGKQQANINRAKNQVMAERASLIAQEQTSFTNVINAYVGVIQAQQLLALQHQQRAGADQAAAGHQRPLPGRRDHPHRRGPGRGRAGWGDRAAPAGRRAICRRRAAPTSRSSAICRQAIWSSRSRSLCRLRPSRTRRSTASNNNPQVVAALFNDAAAKDNVDMQFAQLLPQVSLQGQMFEQRQTCRAQPGENSGYQIVAALSVPIYQGGVGVLRRPAGASRRRSRPPGRWMMRAAPPCRRGAGVGDAGRRQGFGREHA